MGIPTTPDTCEWADCQQPPDVKVRFQGTESEYVYYCSGHQDRAEALPGYKRTISI